MTPRRSRRAALLPAAALALLAACGEPASLEVSTWRGAVPAGGVVRVRDLNGSIRVASTAGSEVVVTATPSARGRRPEAVRVVFTPDAGGVTACALWGEGGTCTADAYRTTGRRNGWLKMLMGRGPVQVDFVVALPAGVRLDAETVNGRITVADARAGVRARTVNGSVTVAAAAPVDARTVNGSVRAQLAELPPGAEVALATTNGSVTALVPPTLGADVDLGTTNGRVRTDLSLAVTTAASARQLRGTLGGGGGRLSLRTTNGSVSLLRN